MQPDANINNEQKLYNQRNRGSITSELELSSDNVNSNNISNGGGSNNFKSDSSSDCNNSDSNDNINSNSSNDDNNSSNINIKVVTFKQLPSSRQQKLTTAANTVTSPAAAAGSAGKTKMPSYNSYNSLGSDLLGSEYSDQQFVFPSVSSSVADFEKFSTYKWTEIVCVVGVRNT